MEYKLYRTTFKSRARKIFNKTSLMVLEYDNTFIYIWNSYEIDGTFRRILKALYPNLQYQEIPEQDFFKTFIRNRYLKASEITRKTAEKKQGHYKEMRRRSILKQIEKLNKQLELL